MKLSVFYSNLTEAAEKSGLSLYEAALKAKEAGISALDFDYNALENGVPPEVTAAGLTVNSIYRFIDCTAEDTAQKGEELLRAAAACGAVAMPVPEKLPAETASEIKAASGKEEIFRRLTACPAAVKAAEFLQELSLLGNKTGVPVCVENFDSHRSLTERKAELEWLFATVPDLRFNLDTGNSVTCGEDILELLFLFGDKVVNVHCKDRLKAADRFPCTAVGHGEMPIKAVRDSLLSAGYTGGFSIEVFGVADPLEAILASAAYLRTE